MASEPCGDIASRPSAHAAVRLCAAAAAAAAADGPLLPMTPDCVRNVQASALHVSRRPAIPAASCDLVGKFHRLRETNFPFDSLAFVFRRDLPYPILRLEVARLMRKQDLQTDEVLYTAGEMATHMYIIGRGTVTLERLNPGELDASREGPILDGSDARLKHDSLKRNSLRVSGSLKHISKKFHPGEWFGENSLHEEVRAQSAGPAGPLSVATAAC